MEQNTYGPGDLIETRKPHPCGCSVWEILRVGADIKIRCTGCSRIVMMKRADFEKRLRKVIENET